MLSKEMVYDTKRLPVSTATVVIRASLLSAKLAYYYSTHGSVVLPGENLLLGNPPRLYPLCTTAVSGVLPEEVATVHKRYCLGPPLVLAETPMLL